MVIPPNQQQRKRARKTFTRGEVTQRSTIEKIEETTKTQIWVLM